MTISAEGIKPRESTMNDLLTAEPPKSVKKVHNSLGLSGYFKNSTPFQSNIDKPLRDLMKKGTKFKWEEAEQTAFKLLKDTVIQDNLAHFENKLDTELLVDAGPDGYSSLTTQHNPKSGKITLVRCDSHAFNQADFNYSHLEKEAFACVWACKVNHIFVYGRPFTCVTDALGVQRIFEENKIRKRTPIRFIRWKAELSIYNVTFIHRAGANNAADFLSRNFKRPFDQHQNKEQINAITYSLSELEQEINNIVEDKRPSNIWQDSQACGTN